VYALDHNIDRLSDDHARARRLAEGLTEAGLPVDPATVETNFVGIEVGPLGMDVPEARARIREQGVLVSVMRPGVLRAATYLGIEDAHIDEALEAIPRALGALVGA
jgi:threonine aldolase